MAVARQRRCCCVRYRADESNLMLHAGEGDFGGGIKCAASTRASNSKYFAALYTMQQRWCTAVYVAQQQLHNALVSPGQVLAMPAST